MSSDLRQHLGSHGERLAAEHLARLGYEIIDRNYRTRWGELDIVACDQLRIIFCEVKTRRGGAVTPFAAIGATKREKVRSIARAWLAGNHDHPPRDELRFDAIGVTIDGCGQLVALEHLEGAF